MQQRGAVHNPVTRELFHGTSGDVCKHICKDGFDRSHCGKNGWYTFSELHEEIDWVIMRGYHGARKKIMNIGPSNTLYGGISKYVRRT